MLTKVFFKNFKSYRQGELPLAPLTMLIGANASGKSNALEGLRLLSWLAQGQKLSSIQYALQDSDKVVRGQVRELGYHGSQSFTLGCETSEKDWNHLSVQLSVRKEEELHIENEMMTGPAAPPPLYEVAQPSAELNTDLRVAYNNFAKGGKKPQLVCSDQLAIFTQLESAARFADGHSKSQKVIPAVTRKLQQWLSDVLFLDPVPARMRGYSFKNEKRLSGDGKTLSSVLYGLCNESVENQKLLLNFIRSLPEQDVVEMGFLDGPRGETMVKLWETFGGTKRDYDASLLSDGTLRVLAIAAAMLSAQEGSLVVIEEIDNGVHPSRAVLLLEHISEVAEKRSLRVLLSSHNPALLDAIPDSAIPHVVFCYRDPEIGDSRLIRLQDLTDYPELIAQGSIGELMTSGMLERFVKHHPGPEQKKARALDWLKNFSREDGEENDR
ncbi:MAG: ATP-binding protein [Pseudomonadota bacterium]